MSDDARGPDFEAHELRRLVPVFALAVAIIAPLGDPAGPLEALLGVFPVAAFGFWAFTSKVPTPVVAVAVAVPVAVAQLSGALEPLMFEISLLALVVGRWSRSLAAAVSLGLVAAATPVLVALLQERGDVSVPIWLLGIALPWAIGRAAARQGQLQTQLEESRRQLAEQALLEERRRIARDVHDFVGHGLAAVMLQVTSARHVLRRDPVAAEEALRSAEEVGRRSMRELGRTIALLRSEDDDTARAALPSAVEVATLVGDARSGGLAVELRVRGHLGRVGPSAGAALYRITQEVLANAARHAPRAQTSLAIEVADSRVRLVADTSGPLAAPRHERERSGYGLIGMRERATALGGEFAAGPTRAGWRVSCLLPFDADEAPPAREGPSR